MSTDGTIGGMRERYRLRMQEIRVAFDAGASGAATIAARTRALDEFAGGLWAREVERDRRLAVGSSLVAIGGYGRAQLFPYSDVDLLFLLDGRLAEKDVKDAIRRVNQEMWDAGIRISPTTRRLAECERFDAENAEFAIALMDHRPIAGDAALYKKLARQTVPKMLQRERKELMTQLMELTLARHSKYGQTIFHLEPNIKDCPGGLRDVHVLDWMAMLRALASEGKPVAGPAEAAVRAEFREAVEFLWLVRCFLHYRHERDDNALDWQAQDAAAAHGIGMREGAPAGADAAYWMRFYFRYARRVERGVARMLEDASQMKPRLRLPGLRRERHTGVQQGFHIESSRVVLDATATGRDPAQDPEVVLDIFEMMARTGCTLDEETERQLAHALPMLSAHLEEGPALWQRLQRILTGRYAGNTLRTMHVLGVLELLVPEFHGIDALVVRDAYHRYTVDEHTFVLIDTLHGLAEIQSGPMAEWAAQFARLLRELPHPGLLYLAALMHDTGKGRNTDDHAQESMRMAESVL
ncbi:MAG TPA: bifunctional uridylyltransferase/uridylyl-removing protein, partial [Edaphobacter sp.]|nr:bifunctional uridylyltransferase/uridylyl-removing protein [Edaphobacter sp.]